MELTLRRICSAPAPASGFELAAIAVSAGGDGLFLYVGDDAEGDIRGRHDNGMFPRLHMPRSKPFQVVIASPGGDTTRIDIPPLDITFPLLERFPDGRILLAASRCGWRAPTDFDKNGVIFDPSTGSLTRILLGDGINHVAVDGRGRIWASYFDEGVFGNNGWGSPGSRGPGAGGLVCFADNGQVLWQFNRDNATDVIDDCYALNATRENIWVFYYGDFKLCHVSADFSQTFYKPPGNAGSQAFAVSETAVLFAGGYGESPTTFHLVQRDGVTLRNAKRLSVRKPDHVPLKDAKVIGRDTSLHVLSEHGWFTVDLNDLR